MLERINNYINDQEFRYTIYENKIHILNFKRIISLENNSISFQGPKQKITIIGNNFIVSKLLNEEMLVMGTIEKIEVRND